MRKYLTIHEEAVSHIYDFATDPFWLSWYRRKILFSFLSVYVDVLLAAAGPGHGDEYKEGDEEALHQDHLPARAPSTLALQHIHIVTEVTSGNV